MDCSVRVPGFMENLYLFIYPESCFAIQQASGLRDFFKRCIVTAGMYQSGFAVYIMLFSKNWVTEMIFSTKSMKQLEAMRIEPDEFSESLLERHGKYAWCFDSLIDQFSGHSTQELTSECFAKFTKDFDISDDSLILNQLYDIFNYLRLYREGGVFRLFKGRQAEWGGPKIRITELDVPPWDSSELNKIMTVYRGMIKSEYDSGKYGQSWTVQKKVASRFANETYSGTESGIIVKVDVCRESIIYFDSNDYEGEVILKNDSVLKDDILYIESGVL